MKKTPTRPPQTVCLPRLRQSDSCNQPEPQPVQGMETAWTVMAETPLKAHRPQMSPSGRAQGVQGQYKELGVAITNK